MFSSISRRFQSTSLHETPHTSKVLSRIYSCCALKNNVQQIANCSITTGDCIWCERCFEWINVILPPSLTVETHVRQVMKWNLKCDEKCVVKNSSPDEINYNLYLTQFHWHIEWKYLPRNRLQSGLPATEISSPVWPSENLVDVTSNFGRPSSTKPWRHHQHHQHQCRCPFISPSTEVIQNEKARKKRKEKK